MAHARFPQVNLVSIKSDLAASLVVFLVALPLCLGIAIASGAPPVAGILSGIIGGLVVASLGGCPVQVSGPANSLIVLVALVSQQYGVAVLGAVVLAAGLFQLAAGLVRLGQIFRAIPPAIIQGLMTGFAILIFAGQFHVMLDDPCGPSAIKNLLLIPQAIWDAVVHQDGSHRAAGVGILTISLLLLWRPLAPRKLRAVPASLVAVTAATLAAEVLNLDVARVTLPENILGAIAWLDLQALPRLLEWPVLEAALVMAFLASTETLLSASAIDRLHNGPRTNYDRELLAQGIGNMACGLVGAVPLTGVVIRSATNVAAGAKTRLASVLHGFWLLVFVVLLPFILARIPTAGLAAILVVAVVKLIDVPALRKIWQHDRREIAIYAVTAAGIVIIGVLPGVLLGIGLAVGKLLLTLGRLDLRLETDEHAGRTVLYLQGSATFMSLPKLASILETVPSQSELHVHFEELDLIDHACLNLLLSWEKQHEATGGCLVLDWEGLAARFQRTRREHRRHHPPHGPRRPSRFFKAGWKLLARPETALSEGHASSGALSERET